MLYNQPWHTESQIETLSRINVGSGPDDAISEETWQTCRSVAESIILSSILDDTRPQRTMLNRIPGELSPRFGLIKTAGQHVFVPSIGQMKVSPDKDKPVVWRNLTGAWSNRWRTASPLTEGVDYTLGENSIVILSASECDMYAIEYEHTLDPVPSFLTRLSILATTEQILISKYGMDHARVEKWSAQWGDAYRRDLALLSQGKIEIPEFASIVLYEDWDEGGPDVVESVRCLRG